MTYFGINVQGGLNNSYGPRNEFSAHRINRDGSWDNELMG